MQSPSEGTVTCSRLTQGVHSNLSNLGWNYSEKNARRMGAQRARNLSPGRHPFPGGVSEAVKLILDLVDGSFSAKVREQEGPHGVRARADRGVVLGEGARHECAVRRYHA